MFHTEMSRVAVGVVFTAGPFAGPARPRQSASMFILKMRDVAYDPVFSDYENEA